MSAHASHDLQQISCLFNSYDSNLKKNLLRFLCVLTELDLLLGVGKKRYFSSWKGDELGTKRGSLIASSVL